MGGSVDPDLVVQAQGGDHAAFERLALAVSDRIHGIAFNILRDRDLAEDERDQSDRAFRRLSVDQRTVIVLHHYLGLTIEQVADTVGVSDGTVKSRLSRAYARLRTALMVDATDTDRTTPVEATR